MMDVPDDEQICWECVGDHFLSAEIKASGSAARCSFCNSRRRSWALNRFSERVDTVFHDNFVLSASEPEGIEAIRHRDREDSYEWTRPGEPPGDIVQWLCKVSEEVSLKVQECWDATSGFDPRDGDFDDPYGSDASYVRLYKQREKFESHWNALKENLLHRSRYFCEAASEFFTVVFRDIHALRSTNGSFVTRELTETDTLYRGRIAVPGQTERFLMAPELELAPPPARKAIAGRMNAAGVRVFYAALDQETCLGELRAPVGSQVVIAAFRPLRPLRVLDLSTLAGVRSTAGPSSMFDPDFDANEERTCFLRTLGQRLSAPVLPSDEPLDYVMTQVVCEFLSTIEPRLDGLLYPSVQSGRSATNLVLFNHACGVSPSTDVRLSAQHMPYEGDDEDGDFFVTVSSGAAETDAPSDGDEARIELLDDFGGWKPSARVISEASKPPPSLELLTDSMVVHEVRAVRYETKSYRVNVAPELRPKSAIDDF